MAVVQDAAHGDGTKGRSDWISFLCVALIGSAVSVASTGYVYGTGNDLYFFPILDGLHELPQFAHDAFIQSLLHYAAGPWQVLRGIGRYLPFEGILFFLNYLSRFTAFAGLLACAELLGLKSKRDWIIVTSLLCLTPILRGGSLAGGGGLFVTYFTHSEWDNGLTLLLVACLVRRWFGFACALNGFIFFVNAFIGVWDAVLILGVVGIALIDRQIRLAPLLLKCLVGSVIGLMFTAPVVANIVQSPDFGKPITFDYIQYLKEFWPYHFLFFSNSLSERLNFLAMILLGLVSFLTFGRQSRPFLAAYISLLIVYIFGIVAPYFTHAPLILNLHLLRVGTMLQLLAVLAPLSLATQWWQSMDRVKSRLLAPMIFLFLCMPIQMGSIQPVFNFFLATLVVAVAWLPPFRMPKWLDRLRLVPSYIVVTLVLVGFAVVTAKHASANTRARSWINEWGEIGRWAQINTPNNSKFLLPTWTFIGAPPSVPPGSPTDDALMNDVTFEYAARRISWIDFRFGAAVMWAPSYYTEWHRRVAEVGRLKSHGAKEAYARANGINYLVETCDAVDKAYVPAFKANRLCVYKI